MRATVSVALPGACGRSAGAGDRETARRRRLLQTPAAGRQANCVTSALQAGTHETLALVAFLALACLLQSFILFC
jgi:hypothetical protein